MTLDFQDKDAQTQSDSDTTNNPEPVAEEILCPHCLRTATNGIKCKGACVADSDY